MAIGKFGGGFLTRVRIDLIRTRVSPSPRFEPAVTMRDLISNQAVRAFGSGLRRTEELRTDTFARRVGEQAFEIRESTGRGTGLDLRVRLETRKPDAVPDHPQGRAPLCLPHN